MALLLGKKKIIYIREKNYNSKIVNKYVLPESDQKPQTPENSVRIMLIFRLGFLGPTPEKPNFRARVEFRKFFGVCYTLPGTPWWGRTR